MAALVDDYNYVVPLFTCIFLPLKRNITFNDAVNFPILFTIVYLLYATH